MLLDSLIIARIPGQVQILVAVVRIRVRIRVRICVRIRVGGVVGGVEILIGRYPTHSRLHVDFAFTFTLPLASGA
jgi:hypothetical protein